MVLANPHTITARSSSPISLPITTTNSSNNCHNRSNNNNVTSATNSNDSNNIMGHQRPVVDLLVAMIAVPMLILCALQLEKNLNDMASSPESRWLVFALGIAMLVVSVIICGYVTHRMGVCIWAGPIDEVGNRIDGRGGSMQHINSQNDILRIVDSLPPSYESVVKFDIPPPPYECLVIDMEHSREQQETVDKEVPANTVMHI